MSYLITSADGDQVAQHHGDLAWPQDRRITTRCVRVMGRDTTTYDMLICDGPDGNVPDQPPSIGYHESRAVWYASNQPDPSGRIRSLGAWADAYPGVIAAPGTTSDPYKSNVKSKAFAFPAFSQDAGDPTSWLADTGFIPQKVGVAGGASLPGGTPVVVVPFSIATEQQMAAIPASSQIVAVWFGGAAQGNLGTLVYDVTPAGDLDKQRRARDHSFWRVYRYPKAGLLPFGADPNAAQPPYPISSGLAWQLGLDVDSQAGYGLVVDRVSGAITPPPSSGRTATGANAVDPGQATGAKVSGGPQLPPPPPQGSSVVFGVTGKKGFGPHDVGDAADVHLIATTPDGEPINCTHHNVLTPFKGDGFDAPAETSGVYRPTSGGGPLIVPVFWRYDQRSEHPFVGGTRPGLRRWETNVPWDVPPPARDKSVLDPGKPVSDPSKPTQDHGKPVLDPGIKNPTDEHFTKPPGSDNQPRIELQVKPLTYDPGLPVTPGQVVDPGSRLQKALDDFNAPDQINLRVQGSLPFTFGGGILLNSGSPLVQGLLPPDTAGTIEVNRGYARTPLEIAVPGILGRPVQCHGPDPRGRTTGLTEAQRAAYEAPAPISGVISAIGDQAGGSPVWFSGSRPGTGLYAGGVAQSGGFALHPANADIKAIQAGATLPRLMPTTTFMAATLKSQFAVADPGPKGTPINGFVWSRDSTTAMSFNPMDATGINDGPSAMTLDAVAQTAYSWGGQLANGKDGTLGQFPIANGDGTVTWGGSATNPTCVYGDGSDGVIVFDGTNTYPDIETHLGSVGNYAYVLSRDVFATTLSVSSGKNLTSRGFRIFGSISITNNGTIKNDGISYPGAAVPGGTMGAGGTGGPPNTDGSGTVLSYGGNGGNGGFVNVGGAAVAPGTTIRSCHAYPECIQFDYFGGGGGGGGSDNGGGGQGGGMILLASPIITNTGSIHANGGDGAGAGGAGFFGGGGGGGGSVNTATPNLVNSGSITANGGAGGSGSHNPGAAGSGGHVFQIAP